jgi:creatinine amidohydrolase
MPESMEVQFERMRPSQIAEARRRADVAFLPLGALEWHGVHNPVGVDATKAQSTCIAAAQKLGGGAVFPPLVYGVPRDSFFMNKVSPLGDLSQPIAAALDTDGQRVRGFCPHGGVDEQEQWLTYQRLVRMALEQVASYGFKSIYICTGHNPLLIWARPVAVAFSRMSWMAGQAVTVNCGNEFDAVDLSGDHAGKWETSLTMAIDESTVDLDELRDRKDYQFVGCGKDALDSTVEQGAAWLDACAEAIAVEARWMVDHYPQLPPGLYGRR